MSCFCDQFKKQVPILLCYGALLNLQPRAFASDENRPTVAVASKVSDDYRRTKLPNGSFEVETYAFGKGGTYGPQVDHSIDDLSFLQVARMISAPLAKQNYLSATDPKTTRLLIMIYWGTTTGSADDPSIQADSSSPADGYTLDRRDAWIAPVLGYESALVDANRRRFAGFKLQSADIIEELEHNRYFVVLMAYDFQLLWKEKKHKLLWETRFSIPEHRNAFDEQLPAMALNAARYFGQKSNGLVRKPLQGHVKLDELKFIEVVPEK